MTRVMLGVRGLEGEAAIAKVKAALLALEGVAKVEVGKRQAMVEYDPSLLTIMDMIRALRRLGFVAGME